MFGVMDVLFNPDKDEDAARVINNLLEKSDEDATKDIMMLPMEVTRAISVILIRDLRIIREEPQGQCSFQLHDCMVLICSRPAHWPRAWKTVSGALECV
jgi:hypothetical protein